MSCSLSLSRKMRYPMGHGQFNNRAGLIRIMILALIIGKIEAEVMSLNGHHLLVLPIQYPPFVSVQRNASSGQIIGLSGFLPLVLDLLATSSNFTYSFVDDSSWSVANLTQHTIQLEGKADILLHAAALTTDRYEKMDFPYAFLSGQFGLMIPMPTWTTSLNAVWKPLQSIVWICWCVSFFAFVVSLYGAAHFSNTDGRDQNVYGFRTNLRSITDYGIQVLLSQGGTCFDKALTIRLLASVWCLTCFVLITAYSSVLISFVTSPNRQPMINSIFDIPKNPKIRATVDKDQVMDTIFKQADSGIYKFLGDMLRNEPDLRCRKTQGCLDKVRSGSHVYLQVREFITDLMARDFYQTGRCDFAMAKEGFMNVISSFPMLKNSPYTNSISEGLMKIEETGLFRVITRMNRIRTQPRQCLAVLQGRNYNFRLSKLTLGQLSGTFAILGAGCVLSLLIFLVEALKRKA